MSDSQPVSIPDTELRQLYSRHTGLQYDLYVGLPESYAESSGSYPVIYLLDGQWDFKLLMSIYGALRFDRFVPEMIIVGLTYGGEEPDYDALRAGDYTPTAMDDVPGSGRGPQFLAFLQKELVPFIEANYRADPAERALGGSSYGGLFCLYALFHEPDLFRRQISISPVISWDNDVLFQLERDHFERRHDLPVRLYLAAGELEPEEWMVGPVRRMATHLRERRYEGLELTEMIIAGERHASVKAEAFNRGLRAVFAPQPIELSAEALCEYAGEYRSVDDGKELLIVLSAVDTKLLLDPEPGSHERDQLLPSGENLFTFRKIPGEVTFHRNSAGEVDGATIDLAEGSRRLMRVEPESPAARGGPGSE